MSNDVRKALESLCKETPKPKVDKPKKKTPHKTGVCRQCGTTDLPKRRRTFCSNECVHLFRMDTDGDYLRSLVWARDKGVCSCCGADTKQQEEQVLQQVRNYAHLHFDIPRAKLRFVRFVSLWEADHIHPRHKGGKNDLDNMQTLCLKCHLNKTAKDIRRWV